MIFFLFFFVDKICDKSLIYCVTCLHVPISIFVCFAFFLFAPGVLFMCGAVTFLWQCLRGDFCRISGKNVTCSQSEDQRRWTQRMLFVCLLWDHGFSCVGLILTDTQFTARNNPCNRPVLVRHWGQTPHIPNWYNSHTYACDCSVFSLVSF